MKTKEKKETDTINIIKKAAVLILCAMALIKILL